MDPLFPLMGSAFYEDLFDWVVYQAEGMIAEQAALSVVAAAGRLEQYCRVHAERKHDVAVQVIKRQLRFAP